MTSLQDVRGGARGLRGSKQEFKSDIIVVMSKFGKKNYVRSAEM